MDKSYITAHGAVTADELPACIASYENAGTTAYAVWTDRFACEAAFSGRDLAHLQELRIFDEEMEFRARRQGEQFLWRVIDDRRFRALLAEDPSLQGFDARTYTETHYLDVDSKRSQGTDYVTTGGGHYTMPAPDLRRLVLRDYLDYDEDGVLQIGDVRLIRFEKGV